MQKKKFDLTSDIITVDLEEVKNDHNTAAEVAVSSTKTDKPKKKSVLITITVDPALRKEYKTWCARKGIKMNEAFIEAFELLKKKDYA